MLTCTKLKQGGLPTADEGFTSVKGSVCGLIGSEPA